MKAFNKDWHLKLLLWRQKKITESKFILLLAFVVGLLTGLAGFILKSIIHFIEHALTSSISGDDVSYLYLLFPIIGIVITRLFIRYFVKDDISHGVTKILYAISRGNNRIKLHNTYSSVVTSAITIGFGGSVGAESPIVYTGAAIGSNLAKFFRLEPRILLLMIGCGAAGAVAGVFKAPIAGLVFTIEVLMINLTMTSVLPLLISSVTSATTAYIFYGSGAMFNYVVTNEFDLERTPFVLLLGVFCGLASLYFTKAMTTMEGLFRKLNTPSMKLIVGGFILSLSIFILPPLYGEGYKTINLLVSNGDYTLIAENSLFYPYKDSFWGIVVFLALILIFKVFASSATNGSGGVGGLFAPSLFMGAICGFAFSYICNNTGFFVHLPENNFALMGMAGVMAGVMHAPLTGIFLIAELTGGFNLFLPLMMVSISAYATIKIFQPNNIYAIRLAQKGELVTHHKDKAVLTLMNLDGVIERDFIAVSPNMYLGDLVKSIAQTRRNIFPVINDQGELLGMVLLDDIRNIMFRPELYNRFKVDKLMIVPPTMINITDSMDQVMKSFDTCGAWNLPVVNDGKYVGFVSKSKIFNSYREVLVQYSEE